LVGRRLGGCHWGRQVGVAFKFLLIRLQRMPDVWPSEYIHQGRGYQPRKTEQKSRGHGDIENDEDRRIDDKGQNVEEDNEEFEPPQVV
jgi:hypothetical protein